MKSGIVSKDRLPLLENFFPEEIFAELIDGRASALCVADDDGTPISAVAVSINQEVCELLWATTVESNRREGLFTLLFSTLVFELSSQPKISMITANLVDSEKYIPMNSFLIKHGFEIIPNHAAVYRTTLKNFREGPISSKTCSNCQIINLQDATRLQLKSLWSLLKDTELVSSIDELKKSYDGQLSRMVMTDNSISAYLLMKCKKDALQLSYLYADSGAGDAIAALLSSASRDAIDRFSEDMLVEMCAINEKSKKLANGLIPNAEVLYTYSARLAIKA